MYRWLVILSRGAIVLLLASAAALAVAWLRQVVPGPAKPDRPFPVAGKTAPIEMASIPWRGNAAAPAALRQPIGIGELPWVASVDRPGEVNLSASAVPWSAQPPRTASDSGAVALQPAVLPWPLTKK